MSRSRVLDDGILIVTIIINNASDGLPTVLNVIEVAPQIAGVNDGSVIWLQKPRILVKNRTQKVHKPSTKFNFKDLKSVAIQILSKDL